MVMNTRSNPLLALVAALLLLLTACGSATGGDTADDGGADGAGGVEPGTYQSASVTVDGVDHPLVDGKPIVLTVRDDGISLNSGCNTMTGPVTVDGDQWVLDSLAMTEMACDEPLMTQDSWISALFSGTLTVSVDGDGFRLTKGGTVVTFSPEVPAAAAPLVGTTWVLTGIGLGGSPDSPVSSVPAGVDSSFLIEGDRISLRPGCNTAGGKVTVGDDTLGIGRLASTMMACTDARGDVERDLMSFFQPGPLTYAIDGDALTLTAPDGRYLTYAAQQPAPPADPVSIQDIAWRLTQYAVTDADSASATAIPDGVTSTIQLSATHAMVNTGCNRGRGTVSYGDDGTLAVAELALTKMACRGLAADVDRVVVAVLNTPVQWTVDGDQLTLTSADGTTQLMYAAG